VLVLTDGGGHATAFSDAIGICGLELADVAGTTRAALEEALPERCSRQNPIDFAGEAEADPEIIARALRPSVSDAGVAAAVVVGHFGGYHLIAGARVAPKEAAAAKALVRVARESGKPVFLHSVHGDRDLEPLRILREGGVPVFRRLELAARVLRGLRTGADYARRLPSIAPADSARPRPIIDDLLAKATFGPRLVLLEPESRELLRRCGIEVPSWREANSAEDCRRAVVELGGSCALKVIAPEAVHRSELGGVRLNVTPADAAATYRALVDQLDGKVQLRSVLVTAMIADGTEFVVGATRDPQFGPVLMAGAGGIRVELERDVAFRLAPVTAREAGEMLSATKLAPLFDEFRGRPALDLAGLTQLVMKVSEIMIGLPEVSEIDLNPVIVTERDFGIADARIALR
jgi:acetyltransferase